MELIEEFQFRVKVAPVKFSGEGPMGQRAIIDILGGEVTGARIRGRLGTGIECPLITSDGFLRINARTHIETDDGAIIYLDYSGLLEMNPLLREALDNGKSTEFGDQYCFINPRLETGDERYSWVNTTFFVAQARSLPEGPEYRVWRAS